MSNILITGSNGQLGQSFKFCSSEYQKFNFVYKDFFQLNICDENQLRNFIEKHKISFLINCAAYTNVDAAEEEIEKAKKINTNAVEILTHLSLEYQFKLIHFSTDYVFDGNSNKPYVENSKVSPKGIYGKTKAEGEKVILSSNADAWIIRTSWLFSPFGKNFVKKILFLLQKKNKINVISDQIGSPTYALDLARDILKILSDKISNNGSRIFHYTNAGQTTWYEFALKIKELSKLSCNINPIETNEFRSSTKRPKYSVLSSQNFKKEFNIRQRPWELALEDCLSKMIK